MKLKGKATAGGRYVDCIAFPRPDEPIGFYVQALDDEWDFWNDNCPRPEPPTETKAGGEEVELDEDEGYLAQVADWGTMKMNFIAVYSLTIPDNEIEWEHVKLDKPSTWRHWTKEIKDFGLSRVEANQLFLKCLDVNSLGEGLMDQARADFLRGQTTA